MFPCYYMKEDETSRVADWLSLSTATVSYNCYYCVFLTVHCSFSAKPASNEQTNHKITLINQPKEMLFDPENIIGVQFTHVFLACTILNPPSLIQVSVSLSHRHPLNKVGHNCNLETTCWRTYWTVHGLPNTCSKKKNRPPCKKDMQQIKFENNKKACPDLPGQAQLNEQLVRWLHFSCRFCCCFVGVVMWKSRIQDRLHYT